MLHIGPLSKYFKVNLALFMLQIIYSLSTSAGVKVAFRAKMDPSAAVKAPGSEEACFGPFNTNVPIPYTFVALNNGSGYNPALGRKHTQLKHKYLLSL